MLAKMAQREVLALSVPKARKLNGQDSSTKSQQDNRIEKKSPPHPYENHRLEQEGKMVFKMGVHYSSRLQHLNKHVSFCNSTCLTHVGIVVSGSQTCIFGNSCQQLCQGKVDLDKTWKAQAGVPAACSRLTPGAGLWGLLSSCQELFSGNFSALLLKVSAA